MEKEELIKSIITQNIDNLHQDAGSKKVYEFHGTAQFLIDTKTGEKFHMTDLDFSQVPVMSPTTGNLLKPDFIFFGEGIPQEAYEKSFEAAEKADVFLVIGTTGEVMPASLIPTHAKKSGATIIEINTEPSNYTYSTTDIFLQGKASEVMEALKAAMK